MNLLQRLSIIFCLLTWPVPVLAADRIESADDPAFKQAVAAWLDDDDATALPELSRLANSGSTAARLLLGQIDREMPIGGETEFLRSLSRKDRKALFRAPGGLSGKSWIKSLADEGEPLARALIDASDRLSLERGLEQLMALGEPQFAARKALNALYSGEHHMLENIAGMPDFPENSRYLYRQAVFLDQGKIVQPEQLVKDILDGVPAAYLFFADFASYLNRDISDEDIIQIAQHLRFRIKDKDPGAQRSAARIIGMEAERAPYLAPAKAICESICPNDVNMCMLELIQINAGYYEFINLDTPLENLIPQSVYLQSERARQTLLRSTAWRSAEYRHSFLPEFRACLGEVLKKMEPLE